MTAITKHLKKGSRLRLVGLGILQVRHRAARMGRNPATPDRNEEWMTLLGIMGRSQYPGSACLRRALSAGFLKPSGLNLSYRGFVLFISSLPALVGVAKRRCQ